MSDYSNSRSWHRKLLRGTSPDDFTASGLQCDASPSCRHVDGRRGSASLRVGARACACGDALPVAIPQHRRTKLIEPGKYAALPLLSALSSRVSSWKACQPTQPEPTATLAAQNGLRNSNTPPWFTCLTVSFGCYDRGQARLQSMGGLVGTGLLGKGLGTKTARRSAPAVLRETIHRLKLGGPVGRCGARGSSAVTSGHTAPAGRGRGQICRGHAWRTYHRTCTVHRASPCVPFARTSRRALRGSGPRAPPAWMEPPPPPQAQR